MSQSNSYFGRALSDSDPLYWRIRDRNFGVYSEEEQTRFKSAHVCVVGLGCVGELEAVMLARIGVGRLTLVDFDSLELSNLNRNPYATRSQVGRPKVDNMAAFIRDIDDTLEVRAVNDKLSLTNGPTIVAGCDVVLQAVDQMASRVIVHRCARKSGVTCVTMSGGPPFRAFVTGIPPDGMDYETFLDLPTRHLRDDELTSDRVQDEIQALRRTRVQSSLAHGAVPEWGALYLAGQRPTWAVTPQRPYMTSVLAVQETVKIILGKEPRVVAPEYLNIDLDRLNCPVFLTNKKDNPIDYTTF